MNGDADEATPPAGAQVDGDSRQSGAARESEQVRQRREKLAALRAAGQAYPNDFRPSHQAAALHATYGDHGAEQLEAAPVQVCIAGRMMTRRVMGKASFAHLQDATGQMQIYVQRDLLPDGFYNSAFKRWDLGDILGAQGELFRTRSGELSVRVTALRLLVKALQPPPEKWHGLQDVEQRYRQRHVDLLANADSREIFRKRARLVAHVRQFLQAADFMEVETPMMQPIPGGATARPFVTHHNALDRQLYLRIAPELYLKRLVVGGFERVFELGRNFRNEGLSTRHNPEFTMLEFYQAWARHTDLMDLIESLLRELALEVCGSTEVVYQGQELDFAAPFRRLGLREAVLERRPDLEPGALEDPQRCAALAADEGIELAPGDGPGRVLMELFERHVEEELRQPTFVVDFPTEVSPLARRRDDRPDLAERFELFIAGREIANGFSELNDAEDQAERFRAQVARKDSGDAEAMYYDADYVQALEYGMPPTAGAGIGIDRLVMLLTDSPAIRDVILFPQLRN